VEFEIFHGQHRELFQRYRERQENQPGALGLALNATHAIYMQDAIEALQVDYSPHIRTV
jgi:hypothetical protein